MFTNHRPHKGWIQHTIQRYITQAWAIEDGENEIEMLKLAGLGVALANGCMETKEVVDLIDASNDNDGVEKSICEYAFRFGTCCMT
jgi:hydroxymethylpyrimidine pyrophosphatase-like HAD family hydrolase